MLLACVLLLASCNKKPVAPPPPPPGVVCAPAVKQDVATTHGYIGQIVAEDWVDLVARVEGFLVMKNFEEGSFVKKDDLVFEIDPRPYEAQVKEAEGQLVHAQASLTYANIQVERYKTLVKQDAASQKDLDSAVMTQGVSTGEVLVAQGQLEVAKINLGYTKISAPFDGKLGVCPISVGNLVGPTINNNLCKLVRMDPVKVEFNVPEPIVVSITQRDGNIERIASEVTPRLVLANGTEYPLDGKIYFADNTINTSTGTLLIRARFDNPKGILTAGEYVRLRIERKEKTPSILIPALAIQRDQTGELVYVVDKDSKVQSRKVTTGQISGLNIVITTGLSEGENVIVQGILKARPGMTVNMTMAGSTKAELNTQPPVPDAKSKPPSGK
ncbi:MAG: hypothetical protein A2X48_15730 [Lentisphaerae bacterium GWF2_49_21]|nr:MAG: hypothetical protein A2X48_15730 [Lentisphaerae bacterium GWF2_49_21]